MVGQRSEVVSVSPRKPYRGDVERSCSRKRLHNTRRSAARADPDNAVRGGCVSEYLSGKHLGIVVVIRYGRYR